MTLLQLLQQRLDLVATIQILGQGSYIFLRATLKCSYIGALQDSIATKQESSTKIASRTRNAVSIQDTIRWAPATARPGLRAPGHTVRVEHFSKKGGWNTTVLITRCDKSSI